MWMLGPSFKNITLPKPSMPFMVLWEGPRESQAQQLIGFSKGLAYLEL